MSQDAEVGDGTTSVVLLAGEFLRECKPYIEEGMHPQTIVKAYREACAVALKKLGAPSPSPTPDPHPLRPSPRPSTRAPPVPLSPLPSLQDSPSPAPSPAPSPSPSPPIAPPPPSLVTPALTCHQTRWPCTST